MDLAEDERNTIVIRGIEEGGDGNKEEEWFLQEEIIRRTMEAKDLRTKGMTKWKIKKFQRMGGKKEEICRPILVCLESRAGADYVYHRRKIGDKGKVNVRRYRSEQMIAREKLEKK